ncbi:MAG: hypothetical protein Tsb0020_42500 [Haliangiales bacterium]
MPSQEGSEDLEKAAPERSVSSPPGPVAGAGEAAAAGTGPAASEVADAAAPATSADERGSAPVADADISPAQRIAALEAENAELAQAKQDNWDRALRAAADLENFRRRSRRDVSDARTEARSKVLREMLPVIDNLERAVAHAEQNDADNAGVTSVIDGVKLVLRQFAQALERCEVLPVEAEGKPFDPNIHEAISQLETNEQAPGSVVQVLQRGYTIGDRLLRPALVVVAKAAPDSSANTSGDAAGGGGATGADGADAQRDEA